MASNNITKAIKKHGGKAFSMGSNALSMGLPIAFGIMDYNSARSEGNSVVGSALTAVGSALFYDSVSMPVGLALTGISALPKAAVNVGESLSAMSRSMNRGAVNAPFANSVFNDNQQFYTMRQAGMQMAQASKYNLQQTLMGNEAQYMKL